MSSAQTWGLVQLIRAGHLAISEAGFITNPRTGHVYGVRGKLKGKYCVVASSNPETGERVTANLHRIIWTYYRGEIPPGMQVNHIDGDGWNNALSNLELSTPSENTRHSVAAGLMQQKLGAAGARELRQAYLDGLSQKALSKKFGISEPMVARVLKNESYPDESELGLRCAQAREARVAEWKSRQRERDWLWPTLLGLVRSGDIQVDAETPRISSQTYWLKVYHGPSYPYPQLQVRLPERQISAAVAAHRFMWVVANGIPAKGQVVHHKNADREDYRLSNLELTTPRQNSIHSTAAVTQAHSKVGEELATAIRESFLSSPRSSGKIAAEFGISQRTARTLLSDQTHPYGSPGLRLRVRERYLEMTAAWNAGSRGRGQRASRGEHG